MIGNLHNLLGRPGEIRLGQIEVGERIAHMAVEAGGNDDQLRLKFAQPRQDTALEGGAELLASYQTERRQVHERTIAEAVINYGSVGNQLVRPGLEDPGIIGDATRREVGDIIEAVKLREFRTLGIVLGSRYEASPIVVSDGSAPPAEHYMLYVPSAHPGCLAPHLWLADGSSLYDHFGQGFTLLVTEGERALADAFAAEAAQRRMPLKVLAPGDSRLRGRYEARFALVRPDQHVAWRGDVLPSDAGALLATVSGGAASITNQGVSGKASA